MVKKKASKKTNKKVANKKQTIATKRKRERVPSSEYKRQVQALEKEISDLSQKQNEIKRRLTEFLKRKEPDEFTKTLYVNGVNINPKNLKVVSASLGEKQKKLSRVKEKYLNALRTELIEQFMGDNPDMKAELKKVDIDKDETGSMLQVNIK